MNIFSEFIIFFGLSKTVTKKCINNIILSRISTAVTQKLLEHSSPNLTNKVYANVDPVLRHAVDQIPVVISALRVELIFFAISSVGYWN